MPQHKHTLVLGVSALIMVACAAQAPVTAPPTSSPPTLAVVATVTTPATSVVEAMRYTVQRGKVDEVLMLNGRVAPLTDQNLFFAQGGVLTNLAVRRDEHVTKGQLIAELDHRDLDTKLAAAQKTYDTTERRLKGDQNNRQIAIQGAQLTLQDAQAIVTRLRQPPAQHDLDLARSAIEQAEINLKSVHTSASLAKIEAKAAIATAADELRSRQDEYAQIVAKQGSNNQIEQAKAQRALDNAQRNLDLALAAYDGAVQAEIDRVQLAEHAVTAAQAALTQLRAGPNALDLAQATRDVTRAQLSLRALSSSDNTLNTQQELAQAKQDVDNLRKQIEAARLYAPFDGVIAETIARPGEMLEDFAPVLTLIDSTRLDLVVNQVKSDDLLKIGIGQPAEITFLAWPGQIIIGTVSKLPDAQADTESESTIRIDFERGGLDLAIGNPASVRMVLRQVPDALWLPPAAVRVLGQRRYVVIQDGKHQREVDITLGIVTANQIQILSGLEEGNIVLGPVSGG